MAAALGLVVSGGLGPAGCAGAGDPTSSTGLVTAEGVTRARPVALDPAVGDAVVNGARTVGDRLVAAADPGTNTVVSPWSLAVAVAMLRAGAGTEAGEQLDALFGFPADATARDEAMNALVAKLGRLEGDPAVVTAKKLPDTAVVHCAQAVFAQGGYAIGADYLHTLARYYGAGVHQVDLDTNDGIAQIGKWASQNTGGLIDRSAATPDPNLRLVLANAIVMAAQWSSPFTAEATSDEPFTRADGTAVQVPTMRQMTTQAYAQGTGWQAVELPYTDGLVMRLVLPDAGVDPAGLDAATLQAVDAGLAASEGLSVNLSLPKWDFKVTTQLTDQLRAMGLDVAFDSAKPGLYPGINPELSVSDAVQQATIRVDEEGTVAAALTELMMAGSAMPEDPVTLSFDHPFRFEILDTVTGIPLFTGIVADPSA